MSPSTPRRKVSQIDTRSKRQLSVLAGGWFIAAASADNPVLTNAIGYAIPGAVFFLISAIRLGRAANAN